MRMRWAMWILAMAGALSLAACSSGKTTTNAASGAPAAKSATANPSTPQSGANPGGDFCTALKQQQASVANLPKTFGQAIGSGDFATIKKTLSAFFDTMQQSLAKVELTMSSAPSNVKAALATVNQYFVQLRTTVLNATSTTQLETSMASFGQDTQLRGATKTLKAYSTSQCGVLTSPTP